jgi:TonB family protein
MLSGRSAGQTMRGIPPMRPSCFLPAFVFVVWAPLAPAQHCLVVKDGDKASIVVAANNCNPMVLRGDKLEMVPATKFALIEGGEYLPIHVAVRKPQVKTSSVMVLNTGDQINREFYFTCELETAFSLGNVFLVITLQNQMGEKGLFLYEIGRLEPRDPFHVRVGIPMTMENEPGRYQLYLFSGGRELFHSMMPYGLMESALDRMVRQHIKDVENASAKPFVGPSPEYPPALFKQGIDGSATLSFAIDARGAVSDPAVAEVSQPAFGEAAMAVIRQWRFLPMVKNGHPVPTHARMPFVFAVPKKK